MDPAERIELEFAYAATTYQAGSLRLRVGEPAPALDALLAARGLDQWAWLTAVNPRSQPLPPAENRRRMADLLSRLQGRLWLRGEAVSDRGDWPAEPSVLVLGMSRAEAVALARSYQQNAILFGERGGLAHLVWIRDA